MTTNAGAQELARAMIGLPSAATIRVSARVRWGV